MVHFKNAIDSMKSHKFKVFISMVWIIIGITSVVIVSSIGKGLENEMDKIIEKGDDGKFVLEFYPNNWMGEDIALYYQPFSSKELEMISMASGVQGVSTEVEEEGNGDGSFGTGIDMGDGNYLNVLFETYNPNDRPEILYGRDFSLDELDRNVVLLSEETANGYFGDASKAVGESIFLEGKTMEIIGVVPVRMFDSFMSSYPEPVTYVPEHFLNDLYNSYGWSDSSASIQIQAAKGFDKNIVSEELTQMLNGTRTDGSYGLAYEEDPLESIRYMKLATTSFTGVITLVSLIIGGIGIMNIMYMAVIERKREIGIRRAIGAKPRTIILQFVTEAAVITTLGGFFGIIVGIIASIYLGGKVPFDIQIDPLMCLFAAFVSGLTGIIFGVIPAIKAAKVDPIKAIQG